MSGRGHARNWPATLILGPQNIRRGAAGVRGGLPPAGGRLSACVFVLRLDFGGDRASPPSSSSSSPSPLAPLLAFLLLSKQQERTVRDEERGGMQRRRLERCYCCSRAIVAIATAERFLRGSQRAGSQSSSARSHTLPPPLPSCAPFLSSHLVCSAASCSSSPSPSIPRFPASFSLPFFTTALLSSTPIPSSRSISALAALHAPFAHGVWRQKQAPKIYPKP
eukprot:3938417-Rhodomonas_salina.1